MTLKIVINSIFSNRLGSILSFCLHSSLSHVSEFVWENVQVLSMTTTSEVVAKRSPLIVTQAAVRLIRKLMFHHQMPRRG